MNERDDAIANKSERLPEPRELAGAVLEKPKSMPQALVEKREPDPSSPNDGSSISAEYLTFGSFVHDYVWSNIILAEQKAALVFAADTAFVGYLVTTIPRNFTQIAHTEQLMIVSALSSLILSVVITVGAVVPRLKGDDRGLVYFRAIVNRPTAAAYSSEVLRARVPGLVAASMEHTYEIARICTRKYTLIRWAIWLGLYGFIAGIIWLTMLHTTNVLDVIVKLA